MQYVFQKKNWGSNQLSPLAAAGREIFAGSGVHPVVSALHDALARNDGCPMPGVCKKAGCARKLAPFIGLPDDVWAYDLSNAPFIIVSNSTSVVYLSCNIKFSCEKKL